jgi:hypothetical protein
MDTIEENCMVGFYTKFIVTKKQKSSISSRSLFEVINITMLV